MKVVTWFDKSGKSKLWHEFEKYKAIMENLPDGRWTVTTEKVENIRSLEQNNSLWAIPYVYFETALVESGTLIKPTKLNVHHWCLHHFCPVNYAERIREEWEHEPEFIDHKTGEVFKEPFRLTTKKMKTTDCMDYYNNLQSGYLEFFSSSPEDLIPDPDPNWRSKTK